MLRLRRLCGLLLLACLALGAGDIPLPSWSMLQLPQPLNLAHPLNRGLIAWWQTLPQVNAGGTVWRNLAPTPDIPLTLTAMLPSTGAKGWQTTTRRGGYGELRFDGTASYLTSGSPPTALNFANTAFTVSAWFRTSVAAQAYIVARRIFTGGLYGGYVLRVNADGTLEARVIDQNNTNAAVRVSVSTSATSGTWTHAVVVFTTDEITVANNDVTIYVNGVLDQGTRTDNGLPYLIPIAAFSIGATADGTGFLTGAIDHVRIYTRGLSAAEVATLYREGTRGNPGLLNWVGREPLGGVINVRKARGRVF